MLLANKYIKLLIVLQEQISQSNITSKVNPKVQDVMRNSFGAKHINNSIFIRGFGKVTSI